MSWLTHPFEQYSIVWLLLSAFLGGVIGTGTKFFFEDVLRPGLGWRRDAKRALRDVTIPLLRAANTLERQINNLVRNVDSHWFSESQYYRLSTLYTFGEYLARVRIIERRVDYVTVEASRAGRRFNDRLNGFYRAMCSFTYFRSYQDTAAVDLSQVPRRMLTAMAECMLLDEEAQPRIRSFSQFCILYETDPQFARWFADLDLFLRRADARGDPLRWDRLIAAGANLRALVLELDGHRLLGTRRELSNLERLQHVNVAIQLQEELQGYVDAVIRHADDRESPR